MSAAGAGDGSVYGVHSLRIGGGTAMNFEHAPAATIKAAGGCLVVKRLPSLSAKMRPRRAYSGASNLQL